MKPRCRCYNIDLDVFENLRHMQKHRVGGALHDLARFITDKSIPVSTAVQYFLPLATAHLCNDQYKGEKHQGVINAVIELVGAVCSQLTWAKYEPLLKHFLNMMTRKPAFQRQIIRVIVAIVDAFHFDLSGVDLRKTPMSKKKLALRETSGGLALGELVEKDIAEDEEVENVVSTEVPVPNRNAGAEKIYRSLTMFMIPGLSKLITDKVKSNGIT